MNAYTRQLNAAQRQHESSCDCCDDDPRSARLDEASARAELDLAPDADTAMEWAGVTSAGAVAGSLAAGRHLAKTLGPDWAEGLPV